MFGTYDIYIYVYRHIHMYIYIIQYIYDSIIYMIIIIIIVIIIIIYYYYCYIYVLYMYTHTRKLFRQTHKCFRVWPTVAAIEQPGRPNFGGRNKIFDPSGVWLLRSRWFLSSTFGHFHSRTQGGVRWGRCWLPAACTNDVDADFFVIPSSTYALVEGEFQ